MSTARTSRAAVRGVAFLGAGNMAEALIGGILGAGLFAPAGVTASDIRPGRRKHLRKKFKVHVTGNNPAAVEKRAIVFLAVKPQQMEAVLGEVGPLLSAGQLVISIAAGMTTGFIETFFRERVPVVRAMPNIPAVVGAAATAVAAGQWARRSDTALAREIFATVGRVVELPEKHIDAVTALSGSGPAYAFYLCEMLERAGREMGLGGTVARELARQTVHGAGAMLSSSPAAAFELRRNVTSPGGTTQAAVEYLEKHGFADIFIRAIKRARDRARELAK